MPQSRVIESIDILEYSAFCLPAGFPFLTPDQLGLQRFEECFDHGIVVAIALAAHRNQKPMLLQAFLIVTRTILRPAISVVDAAYGRLAKGNGHIQCPDRQVSLHPVANCPTDNTPRVKVDDDSQIQPALACPDVGDVTCPFLIGLIG